MLYLYFKTKLDTIENPLDEKSNQKKLRCQTDESERKRKQMEKYRKFFMKNKEMCSDEDDVTLMREFHFLS